MLKSSDLAARIEPFDSFWEGPEDVEKGYGSFYNFYRHNYLKHVPENRDAAVLVISCGPGYFVNMLARNGYRHVVGIDSFEEKIRHGRERGLDLRHERAMEHLQANVDTYDVIICEQEINHLTKEEIPQFLALCTQSLRGGGTLIIHALNGANPITGAEALAQNFDHYNTCTEYTMRQMLEFAGFREVKVFPLMLYVFWKNPLNYVLIALSALYTAFFRFSFLLYGKSNRIFTKKIGAVCVAP